MLAQLTVLGLLKLLAPRFFVAEPTRLAWFSDVQAQFMPVMWWMGRNGQGTVPPLVDPDVGGNGNFTADMQYGALDPLHWALLEVLSRFDDLVLFSWVFAAGTVTATGLGALLVAQRAGARGVLAVPAALGAATSGFFLFFGGDWWPVLWTAPFFLLGWYGLLRRDVRGALLAGLCTWGLVNGGNIYLVPFGVLLLVTVVVLEGRAHGSVRAAVRQPWLRGSVLAMAGGAVAASPTLLTVAGLGEFAGRPVDASLMGNSGFGVPNLLDVLVGGASMHAIANDWMGVVQQTPAFSTFVVALPALALVDWRRAVRSPVVVTALVLCVSAAAATQLPSVLGDLRIPFRYVLVLALVLPVLAVVALSLAPQLTRRRVQVAAGIVLLQGAVAWSRSPALAWWHLLAVAVAAVALVALTVVAAAGPGRGLRSPLAAGVLLLAAAAPVFLGYGQLADMHGRIQAQYPEQYRFQGEGYDLGTTVEDFRGRALATDTAVTVLQYDSFDVPPDQRAEAGVLFGDANLLAGLRTGTGYSAVKHLGTQTLECRGPVAGLDSCPDLLRTVPAPDGTSLVWLDVLAADRVYASPATPAAVLEHLDTSPLWAAGGADRTYRTWTRVTPLTGRVTWSAGTSVGTEGVLSTFARLGEDQERYTVSTGDAAGSVVLRVPYWPGYEASVDGEQVPVRAFGGALVEVDLPAGLDAAQLTLRYAPTGVRLFWPLLGLGALGVAAGGLLAAGRRTGTPPLPPVPAPGYPASRRRR
ncbi:YfhO family protein [Modestobacter muralis]|uniref:YfhO family protein n=1 Tax=Modestobacter muralis TaxID=1608614 RepID=A0A6P0EZ16_9ACTN|nr:YfhO family protein [Modestobacter muralis]NEK95849.1 YfhO family protein [Modestobacter muralis]NEN52737.1 YfhO family protein [Modestobacter muralis]